MGLEIGDTVIIRQWDDMVNKFGINSYGDIYLSYASFVTSMREWCGKEVAISEVDFIVKDEKIIFMYTIEDDPDEWVFTQEMFEETK